jgi:hypothetical protein
MSRVAFIDDENDTGDIRNRVERQLEALNIGKIPDNNWTYVTTKEIGTEFCGLGLTGRHDDPGSPIHKLDKFADECKPEFIFLDNLGWFLSGDLEDAENVQNHYQRLREFRGRHESLKDGVILALHHLTKPGERVSQGSLSLLDSPREYLYRSRGSGRLLDLAEARLGLAIEATADEQFVVVNGVNRSAAPIVPVIMQLNNDTLCFEPHEDKRLVQDRVFQGHAKKLEVFNRLPDSFSFSEALQLAKNKQTLTDLLRIGVSAGLLCKQDKLYSKVNSVALAVPLDSTDSIDHPCSVQ